jgi:predicted nuclease of predicted toxin-antitoxin system
MKLKLDENLGAYAADLLQKAGHDVATVATEKLTSASDRDVIDVSRRERRCLVTLDLDFGNPFLFRPSDYTGIAVLRLPAKPSRDDLLAVVRTLVGGLAQADIAGKLWIVQAGHLREYQEQSLE